MALWLHGSDTPRPQPRSHQEAVLTAGGLGGGGCLGDIQPSVQLHTLQSSITGLSRLPFPLAFLLQSSVSERRTGS